jgi:hypothetical protein
MPWHRNLIDGKLFLFMLGLGAGAGIAVVCWTIQKLFLNALELLP